MQDVPQPFDPRQGGQVLQRHSQNHPKEILKLHIRLPQHGRPLALPLHHEEHRVRSPKNQWISIIPAPQH